MVLCSRMSSFRELFVALYFISTCLLRPTAAASQAKCYFPNLSEHALGIPCDPDNTGAVACCESSHTCLSNGLCWNAAENEVVRGSCTDNTYKSKNCVQHCTHQFQNGQVGIMRKCTNETDLWVCHENTEVCDDSFTLDPGYVSDRRSPGMNSIIYPRSSPSSGTSATTIGLGVGLGVGITLMVALLINIFFLWKARKDLAVLRLAEVQKPEAAKPIPPVTNTFPTGHNGLDRTPSPSVRPTPQVTPRATPEVPEPTPSYQSSMRLDRSQHRQTPSNHSQEYQLLYQQQSYYPPQQQEIVHKTHELEGEGHNHEIPDRQERFSFDPGATLIAYNIYPQEKVRPL
ncbi:hypothetical protein F4778DRAFT_442692 [Xylariomycetidae sp. FL2044]|nr:hypothetical protein F4778DRAFT_442692 [Xylariomycetidae sp. FL2044]